MDVTVNGTTQTIEPTATLRALVEWTLDVRGDLDGVAVAVNDQVVPRSAWEKETLTDGDQVEILTARQGG